MHTEEKTENLNTIGTPVKWVFNNVALRWHTSIEDKIYLRGRIVKIDENSSKDHEPPYLYSQVWCSLPNGSIFKMGIGHLIELTDQNDLENLFALEHITAAHVECVFYDNRLNDFFKESEGK